MFDITQGRDSTPSSPLLMGVSSSSTIELFTMLHPKSEIELKKENKVEENNLKKPFLEGDEDAEDFREGNERGREGSSAL